MTDPNLYWANADCGSTKELIMNGTINIVETEKTICTMIKIEISTNIQADLLQYLAIKNFKNEN